MTLPQQDTVDRASAHRPDRAIGRAVQSQLAMPAPWGGGRTV